MMKLPLTILMMVVNREYFDSKELVVEYWISVAERSTLSRFSEKMAQVELLLKVVEELWV